MVCAENRDGVFLKDMLGSRELNLNLRICAVSRFENFRYVVALPLYDIEIADSGIQNMVLGYARHRAERLVGHKYAHAGVEEQDRHRVFLDYGLGTLLERVNLLNLLLDIGRLFGLLRDIVVDNENAPYGAVCVGNRDGILTQIALSGREGDSYICRAPCPCLECGGYVVAFPLDYLEIVDIHLDDLGKAHAAQLLEGLVGNRYHQTRIEQEHRHRVFLNYGLGTLLQVLDLLYLCVELL